jgi:hypothetical protein
MSLPELPLCLQKFRALEEAASHSPLVDQSLAASTAEETEKKHIYNTPVFRLHRRPQASVV